MQRDLTCPSCRCEFVVTSRPFWKDIHCPRCSTVCEQAAEIYLIEPWEQRCPGCKQLMERGVTYCATCNLSLFDA